MIKLDIDFGDSLLQFANRLGRLPSQIDEGAKKGIRAAQKEAISDLRKLAPMRTGALRRGINQDHAISGSLVNGGMLQGTIRQVGGKSTWKGAPFNYDYYLREVYPAKYGRDTFVKPTTPGTYPNYHERAFNEHGEKYEKIIASHIIKSVT